MTTPQITQNEEGKVNVALGDRAAILVKHASLAQTTKTNFARMLICDALEKLESGQFHIKGPTLEPKETEVPA